MNRIIICTRVYRRELEGLYRDDLAVRTQSGCRAGDEFRFILRPDRVKTEALLGLMQDIILEGNPVVSGNAKLGAAIKAMVSQSAQKAMAEELWQYTLTNERVNVEGYIMFRLRHFDVTVSAILYNAVKRGLVKR